MQKLLKCFCCQLIIRNYVKHTTSEMKYLNVAEKNDAAKTIAGLLSNGTARRREGYSVYNKIYDFEATVLGKSSKMVMTSVSGHLKHLEFLVSYRNWRNVDPRSLFDAPVRKCVSQDFEAIKRTLEREIRSCQGLIIWTDCDREGENIGFEIIDVCRDIKPNVKVYRAIFSEITIAAVIRALQQLKQPDKRQSDAVDVRTELDLRTGAAITRFQTMRMQRLFPEKIADKLISYGSCQIPTLGFVAERYKEIEAFVSEPFWKLKVIHTIENLSVEFNWARNRLFDKQACEDYLLLCLADPKAKVENVTVKPKNKWRPTPMDTVEMEKLGSRKLNLSAKETMTIAEKLYTKGIISYPRTETKQFSKEFNLRSLVELQVEHPTWGEFANRVLEWGPNPRNGNKSDKAHPPIHPTKLVTDLNGNEARVYELIVRHFLACVSKDGVGSETIVHINIAGEKFNANGLVIYERNYLDVYIYDKWNAKQIHKYEEGQIFEPSEISMQEGATTAPPLLTEADLIALMEKHGIGTDATHAEHINTIKERGYIGVVDKGALVPGVIGMGLYEGYDAMELALAKPLLRAEFEADLKRICVGEKDPKTVLSEQIIKYKAAYQQIMDKITAMDEKFAQRIQETPVVRSVNDAQRGPPRTYYENKPNHMQELFLCPKCKVAPLALKQKKNQSGYFIGCLNFPNCKNTVWLPVDCKEPVVLQECCTKCGEAFKLIKFKFASAYYRATFNTPSGWYKTCLRCDGQFRNAFNINLDCVKRVGGIVGVMDARSGCSTYTAPSTHTVSECGTTNKLPKIKKYESTQTLDKPKCAANSKTSANQGTNIRNYFTTAATTVNISDAAIIATEQLRNLPLDEFFDCNDGFDELLLTIDSQSGNSAVTAAGFTDDIAAAFAADDADFCGFNLDTVTTNSDGGGRPPPLPLSRVQSWRNSNDDTFSAPPNDNDFPWGTRERSMLAFTPTPTAKKPRLQQTVSSQQPNFYDNDSWDDNNDAPVTWGTSAYRCSTEQWDHNVRCSECHQPAKELTVKREGPNKGRTFYACPKSKPCKFFKWADELTTVEEASTSSSSQQTVSRGNLGGTDSWGSGRNKRNNVNSNATVSAAADAVQCSCGQIASSLIVRRDNPNKGRQFYACPNRDKSCGFFKWANEQDNRTSTVAVSNSWGSGATRTHQAANHHFTTAANSSTAGRNESKSRKCGLCRQLGHTRNKCPRKTEFEY